MTQPPPVVTISIQLNQATGELAISAPLDQKIVCYGMLTMAMDLVRAHTPGQAAKILPIHGHLNGKGPVA